MEEEDGSVAIAAATAALLLCLLLCFLPSVLPMAEATLRSFLPRRLASSRTSKGYSDYVWRTHQQMKPFHQAWFVRCAVWPTCPTFQLSKLSLSHANASCSIATNSSSVSMAHRPRTSECPLLR